MDDWLNLMGDGPGKSRSPRGPLLLLAILLMVGLAFFFLYKAGQHRLRQGRTTVGAARAVAPAAQSPATFPTRMPSGSSAGPASGRPVQAI
ncbi:MAG: hypothetical protein LBP92_10975 [Deltaproteobacteria bacterium]|jgi:hypothetical protein|nr:hypothetical protein [Deltaproteobacteria bacterium]